MNSYSGDIPRLALKTLQAFAQIYGRDCRVVRWAWAYRRLRNKIWWQWRRQALACLYPAPPRDGRLHVFWHLRGGLGDCAVARLAVLALREKLPQAVFYYHTDSPRAAEALFAADDKNVFLPPGQPLYHRYDVAFETCQSFKVLRVNSRRVQAVAPELEPLLAEMARRQEPFAFFLEDNYLLEDLLGYFAVQQGLPRAGLISYLSALDFDPLSAPALPGELTAPERLQKWHLQGKKYITLHDGIDATFSLNGRRPLKCWPVEKWRALAQQLKAKYPGVWLVQLGGRNSPKFDFADVCLVGQTAVADLPALLQGSLLHIDAESGLVQLTRGLDTRCVVLFGPTDPAFFGLAKNVNLKTGPCRHCMWLLGTAWHVQCALGYPSCKNLDALTVPAVARAAEQALDEKLK